MFCHYTGYRLLHSVHCVGYVSNLYEKVIAETATAAFQSHIQYSADRPILITSRAGLPNVHVHLRPYHGGKIWRVQPHASLMYI